MKLQTNIFMVILIALCGCQPGGSSNTPTLPIVPIQTSVPRWKIYERALAKAVVNKDDGLCEWEILGESGNEVYVWALCKVREPIGSAGSVPAVIQLGENGEIDQVIIPRDGNYYPVDVQALFPAKIQARGLSNSPFNGAVAENHIDERMKSNGPPFIAISGTPLP